ncbi:hypothetical protein QWA68_007346 [Fusarium oxysporum]|nr:hypothetical protein QWA68_007346 [Fusarium oxysporum]
MFKWPLGGDTIFNFGMGHTWRDSARRTVHMDAINRSEASETIAVSIYHVNRGLKLRYHRDGHYQVRA